MFVLRITDEKLACWQSFVYQLWISVEQGSHRSLGEEPHVTLFILNVFTWAWLWVR